MMDEAQYNKFIEEHKETLEHIVGFMANYGITGINIREPESDEADVTADLVFVETVEERGESNNENKWNNTRDGRMDEWDIKSIYMVPIEDMEVNWLIYCSNLYILNKQIIINNKL